MASETLEKIRAEVASMRWPLRSTADVQLHPTEDAAIVRVVVRDAGDSQGATAIFKTQFDRQLHVPWNNIQWSAITELRELRHRVANWIAYGDEKGERA